MLRWMALSVCLAPALAAGAETKHKMSYRVSGDQFVVSTTVRIDGGKYLVLTSLGNEDILPPILQYTIIQNADEIPTTGSQQVTVEWRFPASAADRPPSWVRGRVVKLNTRELELIGGKARKLIR